MTASRSIPTSRGATSWLLVGLMVLVIFSSGAWAQQLEWVADGFTQPVDVTHAGDDSGRLFIAEQGGTVRVLQGGNLQSEPYLDLRSVTRSRGEQGLLGIAFHPEFATNGRLFVHYTDTSGATVLAEFQAASATATSIDATTERVVLRLSQPYANHNGGQIAFGPDGYLYLALGDGGSGGDPLRAGQDLSSWLGTLLRIDVDGAAPYEVPATNPFVAVDGAAPEIWAYGLRNPWRFSFDRGTGDLWIADVGQNAVEEVNRQPAASRGGENYGWRIMEGDACFDPPTGCDPSGLTLPVITYTHASGWGRSITGGFVYRGNAVPELVGAYVFGDYVSGRIFVARGADDRWTAEPLLTAGFRISTFGEDEAGELYVADHAGGVLYRFAR